MNLYWSAPFPLSRKLGLKEFETKFKVFFSKFVKIELFNEKVGFVVFTTVRKMS